MEYGCIYMIKCIANGKVYIGQTINKKVRKQTHFRNLKNDTHKNIMLQRSYNKYGEYYFVWYTLQDYIPLEKMDEKEIYWIKSFKSNENGFNLTQGGMAGDYAELRHNSVFDNETALKIVNDYLTGNYSQKDLCVKYNSNTVCHILAGRYYTTCIPKEKIELCREVAKLNRNKGYKFEKGENNIISKFNQKIADTVLLDYIENETSSRKLGKKYNISKNQILRILNGTAWYSDKNIDHYSKSKEKLRNQRLLKKP